MHYVMGDIHNEVKKLQSVLNQINFTKDDELIVLGDLFDRGVTSPDPIGVYFTLSGLQGKVSWIRGNHDEWLAKYIYDYFSKSERKQKKMLPYAYNTFDLMVNRFTRVDMLDLADTIMKLPLQKVMEINNKCYLFAHAMTSYPLVPESSEYYLMGNYDYDSFLFDGVEGYISMCGHMPTCNIIWKDKNLYMDEYQKSIWHNPKENVYLLDCGCGFATGRLACMCIETGERYYSMDC